MEKESRPRFVLITGCGRQGIGQALAQEFARHGFEVIATVLPGEDSSHLQLPSYHVLEADVTDETSVAKLHAFVSDIAGGRLDILVNNAGVGYLYPSVDYDMCTVERVFAVNIVGPIRMVQVFHRCLIRAKGIIVNIGSVGAFFPTPFEAAYNATKAGLYHFGNTQRLELEPLGVRVVNVCSGEVDTNLLKSDAHRKISDDSVYAPMQQRYQESIHRNNQPLVFARAVVANAIARKPKNEIWHGTWSTHTRLIHRFLPRWVFDAIARPMYSLDELSGGPQSTSSILMRRFIRTG